MSWMLFLSAAIAVALLVYLIAALLNPEGFS
jgi:K+-transporting ATPase KdpF subunit